MSAFLGWLVFASEVAALLLSPRILLAGKSPGATFAWLFGVWLVPVVGPLLFVVVGRDRLHRGLPRRKRRSAQRTRGQLRESETGAAPETEAGAPAPLPPGCTRLARVARRLSASTLSTGNEVELLPSAAAKYERLLEDIAAAQREVHLEYYIWREDEIGARFVDALAARAAEGVEVRLLLDAVGAYELTAATIGRLTAAGAQVAFFHSVNPLRRRFNVNLRNHRKIAVIDGRVAYTGGINIGGEYLGRGSDEPDRAWRDSAVRIAGPAARSLQRVFCEDWHFTTGELLAREVDFPEPVARPGTAPVQVVASGPDEDFGTIHRLYFAAVTLARRSLVITTPYFVPDESLQLALSTAAMGGVDVRLLMPRRSDNRLVDLAARSYVTELLQSGVRVFLYEPGMVHSKTMVVDGRIAAVGTANMDIRSFRLNFEVGVFIFDAGFAQGLLTEFEHDLERSTELALGDALARSTWLQTLEALARLLSPLL